MATFYDLPARYMWRTLLLSKAMEEGTEIKKGAGYIQPQLREAGREDLRNLKALPRQSRKRQGFRRFGRLLIHDDATTGAAGLCKYSKRPEFIELHCIEEIRWRLDGENLVRLAHHFRSVCHDFVKFFACDNYMIISV